MSPGRARSPLAGGRRILTRLTVCAGVLVLSVVAGAFASTLKDVVPQSGGVLGKPYRYWLERVWKLYYESPAPGPAPCHTVNVAGHAVTLVENISAARSTCHAPAHQPVYLNEYSTTCSSLPGQHNGYGTTDPDLQKCSRFQQGTTRVLISVWLDGREVPNFGRTFWKGNRAFPVTVPPHRFQGISQTQARTADWGWSLLLKGLPKGRHTVKCRVLRPNRQLLHASFVILKVG